MNFWKSFGPGVLFAGAAIGTSHLVQTTRAGAVYGLGLMIIVILANVVKYPAYRFGPQYAAATGKSLIEGYAGLGRWVVGLYVLSEIVVIPIIFAATGIVTAGILAATSGITMEPRLLASGLIVLAGVMLVFGGFQLLDRLTKVFVATLTVATLVTTILSLPRIDWSIDAFAMPDIDLPTFTFIIALVGFMPAAMNLSVLQSLWSVAKAKASGERPLLQHAKADFNIGYIGSAVLAICFLLMGTSVMHQGAVVPATGAVDFASQIIALYTTNLGAWAGGLVGVSAFFVMFTTLITIIDGMPRLVATSFVALRKQEESGQLDIEQSRPLYAAMGLLSVLAVGILLFLMGNFQRFIDFVTITAFVVAPITAILNHLVMSSDEVPEEFRPSRGLRIWSLVGLTFLAVLAIGFLITRLAS